MGIATLDSDGSYSEIYLALGITELRKGVLRVPQALLHLSSLLERSVQTNEMLVEMAQMKDIVTIFHGLRAPTLSIQQYIDRIFKYAGCSPSCFIVAYIYLDRFLRCTGVHLNSLNVHRLLITSIMVAAKFIDDAFFNNAYYARVGGISTTELNKLEMKFLFSLDFRVQVSVETFREYCLQLAKGSAEALQIERPIRSCGVKESWSSKDDSSCMPKKVGTTTAG